MTVIKQTPTAEVHINEQALEPKDFFEVVKGKMSQMTLDTLNGQLDVLAEQIMAAKAVNQKGFLQRLSFTYDAMIKEQQLLAHGIKDYVLRDDIGLFIDKVTPKNSVKIIELDRYPRAIPMTELKKIEKAKNLGLFDDFCVVFTDFTENDYKTPEEKKMVERNRDPVVFGYFKNEGTGFRHDRFYVVADWEDEYCDLDFASMIEKMAKVGIKNPHKKIATDDKYLRELVAGVLTEMDEQTKDGRLRLKPDTSKSFWKNLKDKLGF